MVQKGVYHRTSKLTRRQMSLKSILARNCLIFPSFPLLGKKFSNANVNFLSILREHVDSCQMFCKDLSIMTSVTRCLPKKQSLVNSFQWAAIQFPLQTRPHFLGWAPRTWFRPISSVHAIIGEQLFSWHRTERPCRGHFRVHFGAATCCVLTVPA